MMHNEEVNDFRMKMQHESDSIHRERLKWDWEKKACFLFPPRLVPGLEMSGSLKRKLDAKFTFHILVKFMDNAVC